MKKILSYFIALFITTSAWAQVPNGSFENWGQLPFKSIDHWITIGPASKTSKTSQGTNAILLEHFAHSGEQAVLGYTSGAASGGWPYSGRPDTISFLVKGSLDTGDSGQVVVSCGQASSQIGYAVANFGAADSNNFTLVKIPVTFYTPNKADTVAIIFILGNVDNANSWIIIDDVNLTKAGANEGTIVNPGFETITTVNMDEPIDWTTTNFFSNFVGMPLILAQKSTDAKDGSFALKLTNKSSTGNGTFPGVAFSGLIDMNYNGNDYPTFPINKRHINFTGYYKYAPLNGDTCKFTVGVFKGGAQVGYGEFRSTVTVSTYTAFNAAIKYDNTFSGVPDSASITLFAGAEDGDPQEGSVLYVDMLSLNDVNAINTITNNIQMQVFPNPANDVITIDINSINAENIDIQLCDITGKTIKNIYRNKVAQGYTKVETSISDVPAGIYIIKTSQNNQTQISKLQIVK